MKKAFIVNLDLPSGTPDEIAHISEIISESLLDVGLPLLTVEPWAGHSQEDNTLGQIPGQVPQEDQPQKTNTLF